MSGPVNENADAQPTFAQSHDLSPILAEWQDETPDRGTEPLLPVSVRILLDQIEARTRNLLPVGLRFADTQPTYPSAEALEEDIWRGRSIEVMVTPEPRYAVSRSRTQTHMVRRWQTHLRNLTKPRGFHYRYWCSERTWYAEQEEQHGWRRDRGWLPEPYPEQPPWSALTWQVSFHADWMCGGSALRVEPAESPGAVRCGPCFGWPREPRDPRPPAVHLLTTPEPDCLAHEALTRPGRRCRIAPTWRWAHTPVCARHLEALRQDWLTRTGRN